jgi:5-methylcytosine-specific restriction endonuclease McrA
LDVVKPDNHETRRKRLEVGNRKKQLDLIYLRDGAVCQLCGEHVERADASRDHIKRIIYCTKAEARSLTNMRLAHKRCNEQRDDYEDDEVVVLPLVVRNRNGRQRLTYTVGDWFPEIPEAFFEI